LGKNVAAVEEFLIFEMSEPLPKIICKLHLSDEGNWYDIDRPVPPMLKVEGI